MHEVLGSAPAPYRPTSSHQGGPAQLAGFLPVPLCRSNVLRMRWRLPLCSFRRQGAGVDQGQGPSRSEGSAANRNSEMLIEIPRRRVERRTRCASAHFSFFLECLLMNSALAHTGSTRECSRQCTSRPVLPRARTVESQLSDNE